MTGIKLSDSWAHEVNQTHPLEETCEAASGSGDSNQRPKSNTGTTRKISSVQQLFPHSDQRQPCKEALANTDKETAKKSVKELTDQLERLGQASESTPRFPSAMVESRINNAMNLLHQLIGHKWGSQKSKAILSTYTEIYGLLDLLAIHYRTLLRNKRPAHPGHQCVLSLSAALDELSDILAGY